MLVTVLVPCHDESEALPPLFDALDAFGRLVAPRMVVEFLLVDDGSYDDTLSRLDELVRACFFPARSLGLRPHRGLGAALREGAPLAGGSIVVTYDADRPYPLEDAVKLIEPVARGEADVVTASPWHPDGRATGIPAHRSSLSRIASRLYRLRLGRTASGLHTFTCGFRAWRRETLLACLPRRDGFAATAEMLVRALAGGARAQEVPSRLRPRTEGHSKMRVLSTAWRHAGLLLRGR